jgi:hypothetical protein
MTEYGPAQKGVKLMPTHQRNGAVLTAQTATIQTAQVSIQVLRVGTKQVTMGMFRQLPLKPLVDWCAFLEAEEQGRWEVRAPLQHAGTPWGHVNYWWAENDRENSHYLTEAGALEYGHGPRLHLVWQDEEGLYRDIVYYSLPRWIMTYVTAEARGGPPVLQHRSQEMKTWWRALWTSFEALPQLFIAV